MTPLLQAILARVFIVAGGARLVYRRVRRPITVGVRVLVVDDHHVVLVRVHGSTQWDMPGGGVKRGETLRAAAQREAGEETGLQIELDDVLGVYFNTQHGLSDHVTVFVGRGRGLPQPGLNFEVAEARRFPVSALPPNTLPAVHRRLAEYRAGKRYIEADW